MQSTQGPILSQVPEAVAEWVEDMASSWDFQRIIPCHMAAPIQATPNDLRFVFRTAGCHSRVCSTRLLGLGAWC